MQVAEMIGELIMSDDIEQVAEILLNGTVTKRYSEEDVVLNDVKCLYVEEIIEYKGHPQMCIYYDGSSDKGITHWEMIQQLAKFSPYQEVEIQLGGEIEGEEFNAVTSTNLHGFYERKDGTRYAEFCF